MRILAFVSLATLLVPRAAVALDDFVERIPNGTNPLLGGNQTCGICHVDPQGDGDRNVFGKDYENTPGFFVWPNLYSKDSDGDGLSNGMELGDPDGVWRPGESPTRTQDLSFPGDPNSVIGSGGDDAGPADRGGDTGPSDDASADSGLDPDSGAGPDDAGATERGVGARDASSGRDAGPDRDTGPSGSSSEGGSGCRCAETPGLGSRTEWIGVVALVALGLALSSEKARRRARG